MAKCSTCYYATSKKIRYQPTDSCICNYCLVEGVERNQDAEECTFYKEGLADYNPRIGCGMCKFYRREELFDGYCKLKDDPVKIYHPSCEEFRFMKQRICGTCSLSKPKEGSLYCTINRKYVQIYELCPDHHYRKKEYRNRKGKDNIFGI